MQIKIQCGCGAKYSFEIEPVNGQMPVQVNCPKCGTDGTPAANEIIGQQLSLAEAPAAPAAEPAKTRLRVSGGHAPALAQPVQAAAMATPAAPAQSTACSRHPRNAAASQCFMCQKPICTECMSLFGYLCSVQCRFQAEQQKVKVPVYEFQKSRVEANSWKKVGQITTAVVVGILCLFVLYLWFYFVGSRPREFYAFKWPESEGAVVAKFLDKNRLLLVGVERVRVHDLKAKKELWSAVLGEPASHSSEDNESRRRRYSYAPAPKFHVTSAGIWVCSDKQLFAFDPQTGSQKHKIEIPGERTDFSASETALMIVSSTEKNRKTLTRVDLGSGEVKAQAITPPATRTDFVTENIDYDVSPTAAFLLERELDENDGKRKIKTAFSQVMFAGENAVEMQVRLIQPNIVAVEAMKKPPAQSALNANTSAAGSGAIAQEVFNEIKRSRTGGIKKIDQSRYGVTLLRHMAESTEPWSAEVTGPPVMFPQKTVDVLVAGQMIYVFDKQGKKLFESKLTYAVADWLVSGYADAAPCLEENGSLYFFDQGVLTAFNLPSGEVRWRVTTVGISNLQSDGRGKLYVNSTTASPESIQYSEEIELMDPPKNVLLKIDAKSGKILWEAGRAGVYCEVSGKYLYGLNVQAGGLGYAVGLSDALGSPYESSEHFRIYRLKPSSGSQMWEFYQSGAPEEVDFAENRILLQYPGQVRVLKYLSF